MNGIDVNRLELPTLDWLVGRCEGLHDEDSSVESVRDRGYCPSTDWALAGPIIEREGIAVRKHAESGIWYAMALQDIGSSQRTDWAEFTARGGQRYGVYSYQIHKRQQRFAGPTCLIAAMRCYVDNKQGRRAINAAA